MRTLLRQLTCLSFLLAPAFAGEIGPFTGPEADAEAARLYERADNYVENVTEGQYSYAYVQFHWKLAGANITRIQQAYLSSPTAHRIADGEFSVGPYEIGYFKQRVLPRLEEKKVASFDAINCAIFLYTEELNTNEAEKRQLLEQIILTLCRQIRWGEALAFPVLDDERIWLWDIVTRQAAIYRNDKLVAELVDNAKDENKLRLLQTVAEALGFRGESTESLESFITEHEDYASPLRTAIFQGLARRQKHLDRAVMLGRPTVGLYDGVDGIQISANETDSRADVSSFYDSLGPKPPQAARIAMAKYQAFLGRFDQASRLAPEAEWASEALDWLIDQENHQGAISFGAGHPEKTAELVLMLARAGKLDVADAVASKAGGGEKLLFARVRGQLLSNSDTYMVREHTFGDLAISDPNLIGRLICEWSLTPNRALRGAAPWDAIVYRFAPGFDNLPEPKEQDRDKIEASGR